jgi:hypothetical protein
LAGSDTGVLDLPYKPDAAIVKNRFVKGGSDGQHVAQCAASTDRALGVARVDISTAEATAAGKAMAIQVLGVAWVEAGAAITIFTRVMPDSSGRAITAVTATNIPCGVALRAAAAAGDWIPVLLTPGMPAL